MDRPAEDSETMFTEELSFQWPWLWMFTAAVVGGAVGRTIVLLVSAVWS